MRLVMMKCWELHGVAKLAKTTLYVHAHTEAEAKSEALEEYDMHDIVDVHCIGVDEVYID